jgi:hypothetical protein
MVQHDNQITTKADLFFRAAVDYVFTKIASKWVKLRVRFREQTPTGSAAC